MSRYTVNPWVVNDNVLPAEQRQWWRDFIDKLNQDWKAVEDLYGAKILSRLDDIEDNICCHDNRLNILERSLDDLTTGLSQADNTKVSQADKQEQKATPPYAEYFHENMKKAIPPEAEQMPKCLDCGAEMDFLPKAQAYDCFQCGFHISLAAYNRLVEDRQIAERARAELNTEINGNIRHVLDYIVKGGEG